MVSSTRLGGDHMVPCRHFDGSLFQILPSSMCPFAAVGIYILEDKEKVGDPGQGA